MNDWLAALGAWIEHHPGAASWVQAVGATLAVIAAVTVPALQARHARQQRDADRRLRAKSLAIAIYPELLHIRVAHRGIRRRLRELIALRHQGDNPAAIEVSDGDLTDERKRLLIPVTETLRALVPNFYLLGEPIGPQVQKCIGRSMKYNDLLNAASGPTSLRHLPQLLASIENGLNQVDACIASLEQTWQVSADEFREPEDDATGQPVPVRVPTSETRSKETV